VAEGKGLRGRRSVERISTQTAPELIVETLERRPEPVVIVSLADCRMSPRPGAKTRGQTKIGVWSSWAGFALVRDPGKTARATETNLHNDPEAAARVLHSGIPTTLVPAEVTFKTKLLNSDRERIRQAASPLAKAMTAMTDEWEPRLAQFMKGFGVGPYFEDGAVMLHDPLAVATLIDPSLVKIVPERIRLEVEKGKIRTITDPQGPIAIGLVIEADIPRLATREHNVR
jgi:inosine-uridine nucleoside N-ribohydrolase